MQFCLLKFCRYKFVFVLEHFLRITEFPNCTLLTDFRVVISKLLSNNLVVAAVCKHCINIENVEKAIRLTVYMRKTKMYNYYDFNME